MPRANANNMDRRNAILTVTAFALAFPLRAQGKVARVGYLGPSAETAAKLLAAFKEGLAVQG